MWITRTSVHRISPNGRLFSTIPVKNGICLQCRNDRCRHRDRRWNNFCIINQKPTRILIRKFPPLFIVNWAMRLLSYLWENRAHFHLSQWARMRYGNKTNEIPYINYSDCLWLIWMRLIRWQHHIAIKLKLRDKDFGDRFGASKEKIMNELLL